MRNKGIWILLLSVLVIGAMLLLLETKAKNSYTLPFSSKAPTQKIYITMLSAFEEIKSE